MTNHRVGAALGALAMGIAVLPAGAAVAQSGNSPAGAAAVQCNKNHKYTFRTPGDNYTYVYLNVKGGSRKGATVITWPWAGGKGNETWCLTPGPNGYGWNLRPWDNKNLCLDVPKGRYKKGQELIVWNCNKGKNQVFSIIQTHTDTNYLLMSPWYGNGLKIHRGKYDGSPVSLWSHQNRHSMWF
ncbi:RICIN domain-containing protein [Streptomyces sp. NPDC059900]|uniref:RICIN domain-containing protein n=1 Tax=Streptomyces sp. NPDC059900 TaxID=3155816 RepID=UPI0034361D49